VIAYHLITLNNGQCMTEQKDNSKFIMQEVLDISSSSSFYQQLLDIPKETEHVVLDAGAVEKITTPAIQSLLAFNKFLEETGRSMQIDSPSEEFKSALTDLGIDTQLKLNG